MAYTNKQYVFIKENGERWTIRSKKHLNSLLKTHLIKNKPYIVQQSINSDLPIGKVDFRVYYWLADIRQAVTIPFYSIVESTVESVENRSEKMLMIATETTIRSGIYQQSFTDDQLILPNRYEQIESIRSLIISKHYSVAVRRFHYFFSQLTSNLVYIKYIRK